MALKNCLEKRYKFSDLDKRSVSKPDKLLILSAVKEYERQGLSEKDASVKALNDMIAILKMDVGRFKKAVKAEYEKDYPPALELAAQTPEQLAATQTKSSEAAKKKAEEKRIADLESEQPLQLQNEDRRAESDTVKKKAAQGSVLDQATQDKPQTLGTTSPTRLFPRFQLPAGKANTTMALVDAKRIMGIEGSFLIASTTLPKLTPARINTETRKIEVDISQYDSRSHAAQAMAEEILHAIDLVAPNTTISATSKRLSVGGDIRTEIDNHFRDRGDYYLWLRYPLDMRAELSEDRIKAELFARMGVAYNGDPEALKSALPKTYEAYHGIYRLVREGGYSDAWLRNSLPRFSNTGTNTRRGQADGERMVGREENGGELREREGSTGLDGFYQKLADAFGANPRGSLVADDPAFRLRATPTGSNVQTVETQLATAIANSPHPVKIVQSTQELARLTKSGIPLDALGAAVNGTIYLVADNLHSQLDAEITFFHELFHVGLRSKTGLGTSQYSIALQTIAAKNANIRTAANNWMSAYGKDALEDHLARGMTEAQAKMRVRSLSIEEALADLSGEARNKINGFDKLLAVIQKFMRDLGLKWLPDQFEKMSNAEALAFISDMRSSDTVQGGQFSSALSRTAPIWYSELSRQVDANQYGKQPGFDITPALREKAMGGMPVFSRAPQTDTKAFRDWFGDSKVVDESGKPLVVYHGTRADFGEFSSDFFYSGEGASQSGSGFYFTTNPESASGYTGNADGANVMPVYLSLQNPLLIDFKKGEVNGAALKLTKPIVKKIILSAPNIRSAEDSPLMNFGDIAFEGFNKILLEAIDIHAGGNNIAALRNDFFGNDSAAWLSAFSAATGFDSAYSITDSGAKHYVAWFPTQVKSAIGNNGDFDGANPDIAFARKRGNALGLTGGQTANRASFDTPEPSKIDDLLYTLQDKNIDLKRVVQNVKAAAGGLKETWNAYLKEELFHGRTAKRVSNFLERELKPLLTDMQMRKVDMVDFEKYLHARHAEERNIRISQINPNMPDKGSGMTTKDARDYLANLSPEQSRAYQALAKMVDNITKGTRETLRDYGLMSNAEIVEWNKLYPNYVPLMREEGGQGTGTGFSVKGQESKRAMGSTADVRDILANIAAQRERAIVRGEKNRVALALYGLAKTNPNDDFWSTDKPPMIRFIDANGLVESMVDPNYKNRDNVVVAKAFNPATGKVTELAVVFNEDNERAQRMALALKNLDANQLGEILGTIAKATRFLAAVNTQYNPIFGIVNLVRDVQGTAFNLASTPIAGKQKAVLSAIPSALRAVYRAERGKAPTSQWAQLWDEMQEAGGTTGYRDTYSTSTDRGVALQDEINKITEGKLKGLGRAGLQLLSDYNEAMENGTRLAAYKVALDAGHSKEQAASIAKNITVNFNRKGQITQQAGALYAFFNASVQGSARLAETLNSKAGRKIIVGGLLLGVMQALLFSGNDEDDPPQFEREKNLMIPLGDKRYFKTPMPLGLHVIPNTARILTEMAIHGKPLKRTGQLLAGLLDAFNPVGASGLSTQMILPTVLDPFAALGENRDWLGKPIAREDFSSLSPTPGHTRAKDTSTWVSKQLSTFLNWSTGGTDYVKGGLSPTPDQLDYLIGQVTGGVGREISKTQQAISATISGEDLPTYKIPLAGRFYGNSDNSGAVAGLFYRNLKDQNDHEATIKGMIKDGRDPSDYVRQNPSANLFKAANQHERAVSELTKLKRDMLKQDKPRAEVKQVEEQITETMKNFNQAIEKNRPKVTR